VDLRVGRLLFAVAALNVLNGCADNPTVPARGLTVPRPSLTLLSGASGSMPVNPDGVNPATTIPLPTYNDSVIAEFRVDGYVGVHLSPWGDPGKFEGPVDGKGYFRNGECRVNVKFTYTVGSWGPGPCGGTYQGHFVDTAQVKGQGTLTRGGPIYQYDYECPGNTSPPVGHACWIYGGGETYALTPIFVPISLTTPQTVEAAPGIIEKPQPGIWTLFRIKGAPDSLKGIRVAIRVISWRWEAATGGTGQTVITGAATAIQRSAYITEEGRMIVDAFVNGVEQVDTVAVVVPVVHVVPERSTMVPSWRTPYISPDTPGVNLPSTQHLAVTVSGFNGVPLPNKSVKLTATTVEGIYGHIHTKTSPKPLPAKPPGQILGDTWGGDTTRVSTGVSGTANPLYVAPDPSGLVTITGTATGLASGSAQIDVKISGLVQYGAGAHNGITGAVAGWHVDNHWATSAHIAKLMEFADSVYSVLGTGPTFNDTSLQFGGLLEADTTKVWDWPHKSHRLGINTDLKTQPPVSKEQVRIMREIWKAYPNAKLGIEGNHYHLTYPVN